MQTSKSPYSPNNNIIPIITPQNSITKYHNNNI